MNLMDEYSKKNEIQKNFEKYKNFIEGHKNPLIDKKGNSKYKGSYFSAFEIKIKEEEEEEKGKNHNFNNLKVKVKEKPKCYSFVNDKDKETERKNIFFKKSPKIKFSLFQKNEQISNEDYITLKKYTDISDFIQKHFRSIIDINQWEKSFKFSSSWKEIIKTSQEITKSPILKELTKKKTLVIPIEGIFITISEMHDDFSDCTINLYSDSLNKKIILNIWKRPYLKNFLQDMYLKYNIILVIGSPFNMAKEIIDSLVEFEDVYEGVITINDLIIYENHEIMNLSILKNIDKNNTIIIDHDRWGFALDIFNGIEIPPYLCNKTDSELPKLGAFLDIIFDKENTVEFLKNLREPK